MHDDTLVFSVLGAALLAVIVAYALRRGAKSKGEVAGVAEIELDPVSSLRPTTSDAPTAGVVGTDHDGNGVDAEGGEIAAPGLKR